MKKNSTVLAFFVVLLSFSGLTFAESDKWISPPDTISLHADLTGEELGKMHSDAILYAQQRSEQGDLSEVERDMLKSVLQLLTSQKGWMNVSLQENSELDRRQNKKVKKIQNNISRIVLNFVFESFEMLSKISKQIDVGLKDEDLKVVLDESSESLFELIQKTHGDQEGMKQQLNELIKSLEEQISKEDLTDKKREEYFTAIKMIPWAFKFAVVQSEFAQADQLFASLRQETDNEIQNELFAAPLKAFLEKESDYSKTHEIIRLKRVKGDQVHYLILLANKEVPAKKVEQKRWRVFSILFLAPGILINTLTKGPIPTSVSVKNIRTLNQKIPSAVPVVSEQVQVKQSELLATKNILMTHGFVEVGQFTAADVGSEFLRIIASTEASIEAH